MKTILVVYTNVKLTNKEIADNKLTKYAFRTSEYDVANRFETIICNNPEV